MKANSKFDFIIVGGGLSGLHLSFCFLNDKYFDDYSFLIINKELINDSMIIYVGFTVLLNTSS